MGSIGNIFSSATKAISGVFKGVSKIVSSVIGWIVPKPIQPAGYGGSQYEGAKGILLNKDSNNASIPVVYGQRQVGISRVFIESSGTDNNYLYIAGVLCEGGGNGIESIDSIYIDDKLVTWSGSLTDGTVRTVNSSDTNYYKDGASLISVQSFYGLDNQSVSSLLDESTNWDSNYKLSGVAYVAFKFTWNQDAFSSLPDVKVTLKGKKIYDPRLDSTKGGSGSHREDTTSTWTYSDNSALILLDYLRNARYGKGLPNSAFETNYDSFKTSANTCETQVTPYTSASTIDLFTTNGVIDTSQKVLDNVKDLLAPMRALFTYTQGKYKVIVEGTGSSQLLLTTDNIIGGIKIYGEKKNNKYNRVIGTFPNPTKNWQDDTISFPPADDSSLPVGDQYATLLAEDNGTPLEGLFEFRNVTNPYQAEELCEIILRRSRNALGVELTCTSEALNLSIGDIVTLTYSTGGFSAKPFRVMGLAINTDSTVDLQLSEHQDSFYSWASKNQAPTIADTTLPNPNSVSAPASLTLSDQLILYSDGVVITCLDVAIGASPDSFVDYYQVEYKLSTATDYIIAGQGKGLNQRILNVIDGSTYNVRVKAFNTLGVSSTYTSATRTIIGGIAPPEDVQDFSCNIVGSDAHLAWTQIGDLDLAHYTIRYSPVTSGADWADSISLVEKVARPATSITVPARTGSYLIKAVDKNGNYSSNESIIATNINDIGNFNAVATQTESPTFAGTTYRTVVLDNTIRLDSSELFDSAIGNFDSGTSFFDSGLTAYDLYPLGYYYFANPIDLGATYTTRVTAFITQTADNIDDLFDSRTGNFDDGASNFDGDAPANCNAHLEISLSNDNITYSSYRNFVIGDYTARYYKFRVIMTSSDLSSTPVVSALSVTLDMEDRIFSGNDIVSGTGTYAVTFTYPFYSSNYAVGITAQGMNTGDFFTISSKTVNGFNVAFKNSASSGVSKTFDYLAKGY
jgi:hypothetical protein